MKKLIALAVFAFTSQASAGTEVNYEFSPFSVQSVTTFKHWNPRNFEVFAAQLKKVTTKGIKKEYSCGGGDSDLTCTTIKPVEQVAAVEVELMWDTDGVGESSTNQEVIYIKPSALSRATAEALASGKRIAGSKVKPLFALQKEDIVTLEKVIDYGRSNICDSEAGSSCKDHYVYNMEKVRKLRLSAVSR